MEEREWIGFLRGEGNSWQLKDKDWVKKRKGRRIERQ